MKMWQGLALIPQVFTNNLDGFFPSDLDALKMSVEKIEMSLSFEAQVLNFNLYFYQPQSMPQVKVFMENVLKTAVVLFYCEELVDNHVSKDDPSYIFKKWHGIHHQGNVMSSSQAIFRFYQQLAFHLIQAFSNIQSQVIIFQKEHAMHKNMMALLKTEMVAYKEECSCLRERIKDLEITNKNLCYQLESQICPSEHVRHLAMTSLNDLYSRMNLMREKHKVEFSAKTRQIYLLQQQITRDQDKFQDYAYLLSDQMRSKLKRPFQNLIAPACEFGRSVIIDPPSLTYELYNFDKQYIELSEEFSRVLNWVRLLLGKFLFKTDIVVCVVFGVPT